MASVDPRFLTSGSVPHAETVPVSTTRKDVVQLKDPLPGHRLQVDCVAVRILDYNEVTQDPKCPKVPGAPRCISADLLELGYFSATSANSLHTRPSRIPPVEATPALAEAGVPGLETTHSVWCP